MARHRWGPPVRVEVPWSATGGKLYTCLKCGTTRQAVPDGPFTRTLYTSKDATVSSYKAPPCETFHSPD